VNLDAEVESAEFMAALNRFMADQRVGLKQAFRFQGRQLAGTLVKLTPPTNRAAGRATVERDFKKLFVPILTGDPGEWSSTKWGTRIRDPELRKQMAKARRKGDTKAAYEILTKAGFDISPEQVVLFDPAFHQGQRRRGVIPGKNNRGSRKLILNPTALTAYLRTTQGHVGQAKGGWAASLTGLGGNVAAWIRVHSRSGQFTDSLESALAPSLVFENQSEWASSGDDDRIVANAIRSRATQIEASLARRQFDALRRANLK
jgi:hypothetical protein